MKNFVVILTISLILVFLCVAESIVIRNFCFDMEKSILDILKKISDDTCNENDKAE